MGILDAHPAVLSYIFILDQGHDGPWSLHAPF